MQNQEQKILVVLYSHPELYPPTLNAIINLADHFGEVHVLYRPQKKDEWDWPANVKLHPSGRSIAPREFMESGMGNRMRTHGRFLLDFYSLMQKIRPSVLLLYDQYPTLFYRMIRPFLTQRTFVWYHCHDVIDRRDLESGDSMKDLLHAAEKFVVSKADLFTLPAVERKEFYNFSTLKGAYHTLPNYPSTKVFSSSRERDLSESIVLGFQGSICAGRGLEGVISGLPVELEGRKMKFSITGFCYIPSYLRSLENLIEGLNRKDSVSLHATVPYRQLPEVMAATDIGWAYYGMGSSMDNSISTASNKFFESCAAGLPVLYNSANRFDIYSRFDWAVPVELTPEDLARQLAYITQHYRRLSTSARQHFLRELNYEAAFGQVIKMLPLAIPEPHEKKPHN